MTNIGVLSSSPVGAGLALADLPVPGLPDIRDLIGRDLSAIERRLARVGILGYCQFPYGWPGRCAAVGGLALLALGGCNLEATLTVTGDPTRPEFVVTYDRGKTACIDSISVVRGTGTARATVWGVRRIDRTTPASCVDRIRFGTAPRGYEPSFRLRPVAAGQAYEVNAKGVSWSAAATWTAAAGR